MNIEEAAKIKALSEVAKDLMKPFESKPPYSWEEGFDDMAFERIRAHLFCGSEQSPNDLEWSEKRAREIIEITGELLRDAGSKAERYAAEQNADHRTDVF